MKSNIEYMYLSDLRVFSREHYAMTNQWTYEPAV